MKLDKALAEAILRVRPYPAFQAIIEAIRQDGVQTMLDLVRARPDAIGRLQGRAELSQEILAMLDEADGFLEKLLKQQPQGEDGYVRSTRTSPPAGGISEPVVRQNEGWHAHN